MIARRLDIAWFLAAVAVAIATALGAQTPRGAVPEAAAQPDAATALNVVPADLIRSVVESYVLEQIEESGTVAGDTRYEVGARWQGDILLKKPGHVDFEIRRMSTRPMRGPTMVRLELLVDGQLDRAMTVTVDCRHYADVVVTTRSVRRAAPLADATTIEERDITSLKHGFFSDLGEITDLQAARPIGVGDVVSHRHATPIPVVHRGDDITMSIESRNMSLLATGIALEDGGVGQRIRVRNADSKKVLYGEIVDANTIRIAGG